MRRLAALLLSALLAGCAYSTLPLTEPKPKVEPVASIPEPGERKVSELWAFTKMNVFYVARRGFDIPRHLRRYTGRQQRALDIDAFGEVVDSNWFTNRNTVRPLSPEEMGRGAATAPAPGPWTVTAGKKIGVQPGFEMMDCAGNKYVMKMDVAEYPELATSAEAIAERFYYGAGYNVPGTTVVYFSRDRLRIAPEATWVTDDGFTCPLTPEALDKILAEAACTPEGLLWAAAVGYVPGKLKGPFTFLGTRADDPNDTIPHEHRRELRGLAVISALVNNPDLIQTNTMDTYVTEGGKSFLKHYLIDFGSSLGSYGFIHKPRRSGHEYAFDDAEIGKRLFSLGIYSARYEDQPMDIRLHTGYIDEALFDPASWKPENPNPAYDYLTAEDAFWGARIVMSFTDEQIRAAVRSGRLSLPEDEEYLVRVLIARREAIGRHWYSQVSPLIGFAVCGPPGAQSLSFRDLAVEHRFALEGSLYEAKVAGRNLPARFSGPLPLERLEGLPEPGEVFELELRALRAEGSLPPVRVRMRQDVSGFCLLGVEHEGK